LCQADFARKGVLFKTCNQCCAKRKRSNARYYRNNRHEILASKTKARLSPNGLLLNLVLGVLRLDDDYSVEEIRFLQLRKHNKTYS